jgi:hypothetical protein
MGDKPFDKVPSDIASRLTYDLHANIMPSCAW